jgi:molybdenum cofactor cytidylyltransferase
LANPHAIAAIVLAAGGSQRFGADKLLHPLTLNGITLPLAAHSLLPWLQVFGEITVVTRPAAQSFCNTLATALGRQHADFIRWVECADANLGMADSIACGMQANAKASGWLIGLADMPLVPAAAITGVRNAILNGAALAAPYCGNRRGHPVGFIQGYFHALLALKGDSGAKQLLERDRDKIFHVECAGDGIFTDVDQPPDLQKIQFL